MKKQSLFKDSFFATGFILISVYLLSLIDIDSDVVNPISRALGDFKLTDVVFSQIRESPPAEERVVIVNIGNLDREGIGEMVKIINKCKPKVIGIDVRFQGPRDHRGDSVLASAFSEVENLVLVSELHENKEIEKIDSMTFSEPMFMQYASPGFADMITEGEEVFKTSRDCIIRETVPHVTRFEKRYTSIDTVIEGVKTTFRKETIVKLKEAKDTTYYSFPVKIASIYAPEKVKELLKRGNDTETINFQGNIDTRQAGVTSGAKIVFPTLDVDQVFNYEFDPSVFENNVVLLGFMGSYIGEPTLIDIFYTPLNSNYIGKANPDMFGVVVHANILSMILKGEYIDEMPLWMNMTISITLIFFNVWFFSFLYYRTELWYDGLSLLLTLVEILVLMGIVVGVFNKYNYKIDITLASVALFLTGNLIEIHFGIVKPTILKISDKTKILTKNIPIFTKN